MNVLLIDIFAVLILVVILLLSILIPILIVLNRKYSISLNNLIKELPEHAYEKLKGQSREGIDSIKKYFVEKFKTQFKEPKYLTNLILSEEFDSFGIKEARLKCKKNYKSYKVVFYISAILLSYLILSVALIYTHSD